VTEFIHLTDLWADGEFLEVGDIINEEQWPPRRVAAFCVYVYKYLGTHQLDILYKFL
jgi:hypothetical protein